MGTWKIALVGAAIVAVLYAVAPTPYTMSNPPPSPVIETLGQRADRLCAQSDQDARDTCRDAILLRPAYDAAAGRR